MGTSTSFAQLGGKLDKLAGELKDTKGPLTVTAAEGKRIFQGAAAEAGVLGTKIGGKGRGISARYDIRDPTALIQYTGAAHLLNNRTSDHMEFPRSRPGARRRRGSRGARALTINGDVRAWAHHPGTKGKHFYEKARTVCQVELPKVYGKAQITVPLQRTFR